METSWFCIRPVDASPRSVWKLDIVVHMVCVVCDEMTTHIIVCAVLRLITTSADASCAKCRGRGAPQQRAVVVRRRRSRSVFFLVDRRSNSVLKCARRDFREAPRRTSQSPVMRWRSMCLDIVYERFDKMFKSQTRDWPGSVFLLWFRFYLLRGCMRALRGLDFTLLVIKWLHFQSLGF